MKNANEKNAKTETSLSALLKENNIDLSQPKDIKKYLLSLPLEKNLSFFPRVANRLLCEGIYRQVSAGNAKGSKVGTTEYATAIREGFAVWERGYLTLAEEVRATRVTKSAPRSMPFTQAEILARMGELAPSGESENAKRVRETLGKLADFSGDAFTAYYIKSLETPTCLVARAVGELKEAQEKKIRDEMDTLLNGVDII